MGRVDKLHNKETKRRKADSSSMDEILGKNAGKVKRKKISNNVKDSKINSKKVKKAKKKKSPLNKLLTTLAILLVLFTGGYLTFQYLTTGNISSSISFLPNSEKFNNGEVNILLLGSDGVKDYDATRSDTIIVARFNFKEGFVRMISIPRDTYVPIPGHDDNKINAAYAFGGSDLTRETIEDLYDIKIDKVMEVNFTTFRDAVKKLGGVEIIWNEEPLVYEPYKLNIQRGSNILDDREALYFVRFRKTATADLGRIGRQQLFLKSLARDIKTKANFIEQIDIINSIYKGIKTDLNLSEMLYMFNKYKEFDNFKITTWMSAGYVSDIEGIGSVVLPEEDVDVMARGFLDGNLVVSQEDEGGIFPELISVEEKAIADQEEAKEVAEENSK